MNWKQTRDALITAGIDPARLPDEWKSNINLSGATLSDAYLRNAYLRNAYLRDANLRGADLSDANLRGADLSGSTLSDAYLRDANLRDANLSGATLSDAILSDADLSGSTLSDATLNWNSHDLLAELAIRAAGNDYRRRMDAGLILVSRDWRWEKFITVLDSDTQDWLGSVFAPYVKDGDGAPDVVRQYAKAGVQR